MSAPKSPQRDRRRPRYAVIMAGGHGTRFWPRSRRHTPKQLLPITGRRTLLQETVRRLVPLFSWRHIVIVTSGEHVAEVRRQLPRIPADQILVEPAGRNTAPCIALAAAWLSNRAADAVMAVVAADHVIKDAAAVRRTLRNACELAARQHCLVTVGIQPTRAETGYGYVEVGPAIAGHSADAFWVRRFHEKPLERVAKRYVASGRFLWNACMFVWEVSAFQRALELCLPDVAGALKGIWRGPAIERRLRRAYRKLPSISVDVGIMQPISAMADAPRVAVVRAGFDWSDVGSWVAMPEIWGCDKAGNAALGKILPIDASDSIVYSPTRLVALVGVNNLIVVDSDDALLICRRDHAQDVRKVTQALKDRGWSKFL